MCRVPLPLEYEVFNAPPADSCSSMCCRHARWESTPLRSRAFPLLLAAAAQLLLAAGDVLAQQPGGVLHGRVTGTAGTPLNNAQVVIVGAAASTLSDRSGRFHLRGIPLGPQVLEIHFVGYETAVRELEFAGPDVVTVKVALEPKPVELDEVRVRGSAALPPHLQGFYQRRHRGAGHFFTQAEIGRMQARSFTDILRRVPGVVVGSPSGRYGTSPSVQIGRATGIAGARDCPVLYFVNGQRFPVAPELGINHFVRPDEIAALEVYTGSSRLPPQFHASQHNARCGVVVIWTRTGPARGSDAR